MPFLWSTIATKGQLFGNREAGSEAYVTNGMNFSYPGYNESLTGAADPKIDSNDKKYNQNVTVLEWLHQKPATRVRSLPSEPGTSSPISSTPPAQAFP
jgi:hypothetical protein